MKKIAIIAAALAICGSAVAQNKTPKEIACPIMTDHKVNIVKATKDGMFADYKGRRYFFCCGGCAPAFKKDPAKYAKMPSIPTPKKKA